MNPQTLRQTTVNGGRSASLFWAFSLFTKLLGILGSAIATFDGLRKLTLRYNGFYTMITWYCRSVNRLQAVTYSRKPHQTIAIKSVLKHSL